MPLLHTCRQIDLFTWKNLDFLPIFAVGNNGVNTSSGLASVPSSYDSLGLRRGGTVLAPATSKNCIGVGAVDNYVPPSEATAPLMVFTVSQQESGRCRVPACAGLPCLVIPRALNQFHCRSWRTCPAWLLQLVLVLAHNTMQPVLRLSTQPCQHHCFLLSS